MSNFFVDLRLCQNWCTDYLMQTVVASLGSLVIYTAFKPVRTRITIIVVSVEAFEFTFEVTLEVGFVVAFLISFFRSFFIKVTFIIEISFVVEILVTIIIVIVSLIVALIVAFSESFLPAWFFVKSRASIDVLVRTRLIIIIITSADSGTLLVGLRVVVSLLVVMLPR